MRIPWDLLPWIAGGAALAAVALSRRHHATYGDPSPASQGVPFALGETLPMWPIQASKNKRWLEVAYEDVNGTMHGNPSRRFKAKRPATGTPQRYHVGIDLYANAGDIVVAPESGTVVGTQHFLPGIPGEDAIMIRGERGVTILLGEMAAGSWKSFDVTDGSVVRKGQPVGRVGLTANGSHMLHFETYSCCPTHNESWYIGKPRPDHVLDPTDYLLRARLSQRAVT